MTVIRAIAPVHTGLAEISGAAERDPAGYHDLWERVEREIAPLREIPGVEINLYRATESAAGMQYRSKEHDLRTERRELLTIRATAASLGFDDLSSRYGDRITEVEEITLRVFAHEIALLETSFTIGAVPGHLAEERMKRLEIESVALTEEIAHALHERVLQPILDAVITEDTRWRFMINENEESLSCRNHALVFWVSCSLLVAEEDGDLLKHWLKDSVAIEDLDDLEKIADGKLETIVRWMNYGFLDIDRQGHEAFRTGRHAHQYRALRHAQEVYSSLDHVDHRLKVVLANAVATGSRMSLEIMNEDLQRLSQRAEVIIMGKQELLKYVPRAVRGHFDDIMAAWEYDVLVEQPALFKLELCARRLGELSSRRAARATVVTDIILLGIGITSIGGIALAISDFGRNSATDPRSTGYDLGASSFTSWFAAQPIDIVLLVSAAASALLIVLYLYFRRDDRG